MNRGSERRRQSSPAGLTRDPMRLRSGSCGLPSTRSSARLNAAAGASHWRTCPCLPSWPCRSSALRPFSSWESSRISSSGESGPATCHRPRLSATVSPSAAAGAEPRRAAPKSSPCQRQARSTSCGAFHAGSIRKSLPSPSTARPSGSGKGSTPGARRSGCDRPTAARSRSSSAGPTPSDAWLAEITGNEAFEVSEPQSVTVDGVDGFVVDVRLAEGADRSATADREQRRAMEPHGGQRRESLDRRRRARGAWRS